MYKRYGALYCPPPQSAQVVCWQRLTTILLKMAETVCILAGRSHNIVAASRRADFAPPPAEQLAAGRENQIILPIADFKIMTIKRYNRRRMVQLFWGGSRHAALKMVSTSDDWEFYQFMQRWFT